MNSLTRSAAFALDLANQPEGYLSPDDDVIEALRSNGLITTASVGDGFVIARAVRVPQKHERAMNWHWYRARRAVTEEGISA